jgi:hypothetical protein
MGAAWLDVRPGGDVDAVLADLRVGEPADEPSSLSANLVDLGEGWRRVAVYSDDGYQRLGDLVVGVMERTGVVGRALVVNDHDEYGAEHVALASADESGVRRVHHVYVYPRGDDGEVLYEDDGMPALTRVPGAAGAGPGPDRGQLLADAGAQASVAALYGVPIEAVRAATVRAATAYEDLQIIAGPVEPWLDALKVAWSSPGPTMNLRPGPVWRDWMRREVLPHLPDRWIAHDDFVVREPVTPVACVLLPGRWRGCALLRPLYVPKDHWTLQFSKDINTLANKPAADPQPLLRELTDVAVPFFDRHGHLDSVWQLCRERITGRPLSRINPHDLNCRAATEVMLGRNDAAAASYAGLAAMITAENDPPDWLTELGEQAYIRSRLLPTHGHAVREALTATIDQQLANLGLPPA